MVDAQSVSKIKSQAALQIASAQGSSELEAVRLHYLGKKGELSQLMKGLSALEPQQKKEFGAILNQVKTEVENLLSNRQGEISRAEMKTALQSQWLDVTLPVSAPVLLKQNGSLHPLTRVQYELERIFNSLGFLVVDGPEVESEYYNFDALNVPSTHPARDMQDTIWTKPGSDGIRHQLRTQTSAMQVRALENLKPPLRIVAPGRCFRYERIDATHEHTFYQMEGMMVDRVVSVGHLLYFMRTLLREIFGFEPKVRLRPGYFPFVEPGFELDIWFNNRWLELLPCGLVHPRVLEYGGIDANEWQGFAFGLGLSRLVMSRFGIDDIRHLQGGDLRFLQQFA